MSSYQVTVFEDHPTIIRSTHVIMSEGLRPRRIVLRKLKDEYVVHREYMNVKIVKTGGLPGGEAEREEVTFVHSDFDQGDYFNFGSQHGHSHAEAYEAASKRFFERARKV